MESIKANTILYRNATPPELDEIINYIETVCNKYNIDFENLRNETNQRFNFILNQIGLKFFKYTDIFKTNTDVYQNNITYNIDKIKEYAYIYILLCDLYNKIPSVLSFTSFAGIAHDITLSPPMAEIIKIINLEREQRLVNTLEDGKKNPVGTIAILNKAYNWQGDGRGADAGNDRKTLSVNDLKDIFTTLTPQKRIE